MWSYLFGILSVLVRNKKSRIFICFFLEIKKKKKNQVLTKYPKTICLKNETQSAKDIHYYGLC